MKTLLMAAAALGTLATGAATAEAQDHRLGKFRHGWGYEIGPREQRCEPSPPPRVRYEDVWVERPVTVYETRTVYRSVFTGYDFCGRPVYRTVPVCEQVSVTRMQRVCEQQPVYGSRGHSFTFGR